MVSSIMSNSNQDAIQLTSALHQGVVTLGLQKMVDYLNLIAKLNSNSKAELADSILNLVCSHLKISAHDVKNSARNDGSRIDALCILSLMLKKHLMFSQNEVASFLNKHKSQVSKYVSKMTRLNEHIESDRKLASRYRELEIVVIHLLVNKA